MDTAGMETVHDFFCFIKNEGSTSRVQNEKEPEEHGVITSEKISIHETTRPTSLIDDSAIKLELIHQILLENPTWVSEQDKGGCTILHWAAQSGSASLIQLLIDHNTPLDEPDENGLLPIHWAAAANNLSAIRLLLSLPHYNPLDCADAVKHRSPLLLAAQYGHTMVALYLLKRGANPSLVDNFHDNFIHWSAYKGAAELVRVCHANAYSLGLSNTLFTAPDAHGHTPLHLAAMQGHLEIVKFLVEEVQVDIFGFDTKGMTPLALAQSRGHSHVASYMISRERQALCWLNVATLLGQDHLTWNLSTFHNGIFYFQTTNLLLVPIVHGAVLSKYDSLQWYFQLHFILVALTWFFFICVWRIEPGYVDKDSKYSSEYNYIMEQLVGSSDAPCSVKTSNDFSHVFHNTPMCHVCQIVKPLRSKHCRHCNRCVYLFDHHCPFVKNCVGQNNYIPFLGFILNMSSASFMFAWIWYTIWTIDNSQWFGAAMIYYLIVGISSGSLFIFHLFLARKNITTNEHRNRHRYTYLNEISSQGLRVNLMNCLRACVSLHWYRIRSRKNEKIIHRN